MVTLEAAETEVKILSYLWASKPRKQWNLMSVAYLNLGYFISVSCFLGNRARIL